MSAPVKKKCPKCSKLKLKRLIGSGSAVVFKGSGFYETDYRSDAYKKDAKADKSEPSTKTKKSDGAKKESKKSSPPPKSS